MCPFKHWKIGGEMNSWQTGHTQILARFEDKVEVEGKAFAELILLLLDYECWRGFSGIMMTRVK